MLSSPSARNFKPAPRLSRVKKASTSQLPDRNTGGYGRTLARAGDYDSNSSVFSRGVMPRSDSETYFARNTRTLRRHFHERSPSPRRIDTGMSLGEDPQQLIDDYSRQTGYQAKKTFPDRSNPQMNVTTSSADTAAPERIRRFRAEEAKGGMSSRPSLKPNKDGFSWKP